MSELKTTLTNADADEFVSSVGDDKKKNDGLKLLEIFSRITNEKPRMWGSSIVGFGQYHYKSQRSSQEGDWPLIGFSPRKQNLTLYFMNGFDDYGYELQRLGKHKTSKGCLYINKLEDVDQAVLEDLIKKSYLTMKKKHGQ